ncbi:MAG: BACON domain-containing protein [Bacteroidales bacterium]|nr:BACON domain-containing protein [Bacteroidales bacterium]
MRIFKTISKICASALAFSMLFGCEQDNLVKPHALLSESSLTFKAIGAEPQLLTIASDEAWIVDAPEWINVDPMSGSSTVKVTVTVDDNVDSKGVMAPPREGIITIAAARDGYSIETVIYQKGDNYIGIKEYSVTETAALNDNDKAKVTGGYVTAIASEGFVVTDGTTLMYVTSNEKVAVGDQLFFNGSKTTVGGMPVFIGDEVEVLSSKEVTYPEAEDITSKIDSYSSNKVALVSVSGTVVGSSLKNIPGSPAKGVTLYKPHDSIGLSEVNMHKVVLTGYYIGTESNALNIVVVSFEDNGIDDNIGVELPFKDDFSWLTPMIQKYNASNANQVGNTITGYDAWADAIKCTAPNVYTAEPFKSEFQKAFTDMGYKDLNPKNQVIYAQDTYLKFNKTGDNSRTALQLPYFKLGVPTDILIEFDWACMIQGDGKLDDNKMKLVIMEGDGEFENGTKISDEIETDQKSSENFKWTHAAVKVKNVTTATGIALVKSPAVSEDGTVDLTGKSIGRFFIDNIEVMNAADAVPSTISVGGIENNSIAFDGTPDGPATFTVTSDKAYSLTASARWFSIDVTEGDAYMTKTVTVTCEPSDLSTLRQGTIVIKSGTTTQVISVFQSAAGQELAPFVSLTTGNSVTVLGEGDSFTATVQTNADYKVEILDSWLTEAEVPATKARVDYFDHTFDAAVNLTGEARTGKIRFYNDKANIETVLTVKQENFEPRITVTPKSNIYPGISGIGGTVTFNIDANIPFNVSADASWVKLPVSQGVAGTFDVPVAFEANTSASARSAKVTFTNEQYSYSLVLDVSQYAAGVIFADDFSWLAPLVKAVNPDGSKNYDTVGKHDLKAEAPNIYGTAALKAAFVPLCNQIGYYIPGKADGANDVLYLQDCYIKLGKTSSNSQTSFTLPSMDPAGKSMTISFDWARMEQGDGTIDNYTLTLMIEGNGTFENGTKYSDELSTKQQKGEMFWSNYSVKVSGADKDTRITFVPTALLDKTTGTIDYKVSGGKRAFYDNIVVKVD